MKVEAKPRRRSRNGHARRSNLVATAVKGRVAAMLLKLLLKRSVLMAIGLGTVAAWYVKRRFFRPAKRSFLGF